MSEKLKVAVLMGGDSSERAISLKTGRAISSALSPQKFEVQTFDVALETSHHDGSGTGKGGVSPVSWRDLIGRLRDGGFDVVLPALHGGWGEDGTAQALIEIAGLPYVGSSPRASVVAMEKNVAKAVLREAGLLVPRGEVVRDENEIENVTQRWAPPCVVKPSRGGSSIAITIFREAVEDWPAAFRCAIEAAWKDGSPALIEELISGQEITAAVIGVGEAARALPLLEIVPRAEWYDYESKYLPGGSQHLSPPRLPESVQQAARELALRAHRILGCGGVSRSDFMVDENGAPYFLEINTVPGMTATSLVPDAARAAGMSFGQLLEELIEDALAAFSP